MKITTNKHGACRTKKDPAFPRVFVDFDGYGFGNKDARSMDENSDEYKQLVRDDFILRRIKSQLVPVDKIAKKVIEDNGWSDVDYYWDDYAGCDVCPCSGGIVIRHEHPNDFRCVLPTQEAMDAMDRIFASIKQDLKDD